MRLLAISLEKSRQKPFRDSLNNHGVLVDFCVDITQASELIYLYSFDVIALYGYQENDSEVEFIKKNDSASDRIPFIISSEWVHPDVKSHALFNGADDYIPSDCDFREFVARLYAVSRRNKGVHASKLRSGDVTLSLEHRQVYIKNEEIYVTSNEYSILQLLLSRKGKMTSKATMINYLYGTSDAPELKIIDVFVCKLRKKLTIRGVPDIISTIWGQGYMIRDHEDIVPWPPCSSSSKITKVETR